ncbi:MAG: hypothetical protein LUH12_05930, partial [Bacteroides sp.]|nr:hypothetical protein [Bacteroides sp.]
STYCSIAEMAKQIADSAGIQVKFDVQPEGQNGYPNTLYMDLDTGRLKTLGWTGGEWYTISQMVYRMAIRWESN